MQELEKKQQLEVLQRVLITRARNIVPPTVTLLNSHSASYRNPPKLFQCLLPYPASLLNSYLASYRNPPKLFQCLLPYSASLLNSYSASYRNPSKLLEKPLKTNIPGIVRA